MKTYTLDEVQNQLIGKTDTPERDRFESELQLELIGQNIKQTQLERNLTQQQLIERANQSRSDYLSGNFKSQEELEEESENW